MTGLGIPQKHPAAGLPAFSLRVQVRSINDFIIGATGGVVKEKGVMLYVPYSITPFFSAQRSIDRLYSHIPPAFRARRMRVPRKAVIRAFTMSRGRKGATDRARVFSQVIGLWRKKAKLSLKPMAPMM